MLFIGQGCVGNSFTPSPTQVPPAATATATFLPTYPSTATVFRTSTPDDVSTLRAHETASIETLISTAPPTVLEEKPSLDGKWQTQVIRYDCTNYRYPDYTASIAYEQLKLINLPDGTEQIIEDQLQNCDGIGGSGLKGLYWSPSNRHFYYTDWREGNPESCGNYIVPMIYRFDTLTQENSMVGGGHISPDKTMLAMWEWQKNEIVIWDLDLGEVGRIPGLISDMLNGQIAWSPDSRSLVYLQTTFDCAPDYGKTYLTRLDLEGMSQKLLLEQDTPGFASVKWETMDQLSLRNGNNREWRYDLVSKQLKAIP